MLTWGSAQATEPVLQVRDIAIPEVLAPERLPIGFYTFEPDEFWAEPRDSWWMRFTDWVIRQEREHGQTVQSFGAWADRTLSGSSRALPNNESYLRLGFAAESEYANLAQFEPELRFRLDVPTAEEKLRLVVESESEELIPLAERERDRQLTEPDRTETETTGALRFLTQVGDAINLSTDIGGRLRLPPEMFWRMTARKGWSVGGDWAVNLQQRLYYYHTEGWGARTRLGSNRALENGWHYYNSSELEWVHHDRKFVAAHIHSLRKRLNTRSVITPRIGVLGESQPSWRTTGFFADITWRYRMYEDWLFAELVPALDFPREDGFGDKASVIFRIEMYFSGTIDRD
ncbi:hypothetical protein [Marinobacter daepoensis]|uniref:hypothetical protein n=1 Tax=Marinobacter daepoensis TaxID=262077 RepID=UPI001F4985A9|nr:hypothetical protein [Marinobacter daepoensis]